jgi:hypothetical protein
VVVSDPIGPAGEFQKFVVFVELLIYLDENFLQQILDVLLGKLREAADIVKQRNLIPLHEKTE